MPSTSSFPINRLTAAELMAFDDIAINILIDCVYYWTTVRKNGNLQTTATSETVTSILQKAIQSPHQETGLSGAESELVGMPSLQPFYQTLSAIKAPQFNRHLMIYLDIYMPDCPFEVLSTNRSTESVHDTAIAARQLIKRNDIIKYLCGTRVRLTPEEQERLRDHPNIVESSKNKKSSLFLGPAGFVKHDCMANATLMPIGLSGIEVRANRDILPGEEITVTYSHPFDEANYDCPCKTCERKKQQEAWLRRPLSTLYQLNSQFRCDTCRWIFPHDIADTNIRRCPNCKRHKNLYGLEWPYRCKNQSVVSPHSAVDTDDDDIYFPTVEELLSCFSRRRSQRITAREPSKAGFRVNKWQNRRGRKI